MKAILSDNTDSGEAAAASPEIACPPATAEESRARSSRFATQYLRAKRRVKRLYLIIKGGLRSLIGLTGWIVGLAFLVLLFRDITTDHTVIQPISVGKSLGDDGLTSEVAARRLQDAMNAMLFAAANAGGGSKVQVSFGKDLPEIVVPTVGMSLSTLSDYVRVFLNLSSRTSVTGEVVVAEKKAGLVLRLNGREVYRSPEPIPLDQIDRMWGPAAETLLRHISPYQVALSVYDTNPDKAEKIADYIVRYYPENDENVAWARVILGMRHEAYLQYGKAREEFETALSIAAKSRWAPFRRMPFWASLRRVPSYAQGAQLRLGSMLLDRREFRAAIDAFKQAVAMDPTDPAARQYLGMARKELNAKDAGGDFDEANRLLRKAIQDYDRQGGAGSGAATLHLNLGVALQLQGREGAEVEYKRAMQLDPDDRSAPAAYCALSSEIFRKNYDFCLSSLQHAPADFTGQILLMNYLSDMGNKSEAIKVMLNAIDHDDRRPQFHHALGNLYAREKDWDQAKLKLLKAIELAPEAAVQHNDLGNMHYDRGEFSDAERAYSAAIKYNPHAAHYHNKLASALRELKQFDRATAECQKAIELEPKNADHYLHLGYVFYQKHDYANAAEAIRKAIAIDSRAEFHIYLGLALDGVTPGSQEARQEYRQAIKLNPTIAEPYYYLATALAKDATETSKVEACALAREAAKIDPANQLFSDKANDICGSRE